MAKVDGTKKEKPKPRLTDKEQSERFKEAARELGVDESGTEFEEVFQKIIKPHAQSTAD
ncbi:hypothetical protein [Tardiphaga sp.]|uniref:hypothetical protein n=1 Tax=Tardiphaga sp. TaxID=1926292 RepID=UPI0026281F4C|nr:hypothetical protein [Tardiphaga sp.]MDB5616039.1 hypothetical protein [Tardiphaga sp.]